jgi:hypothetical protein
MNTDQACSATALRHLVDKWLAPTPSVPARVRRIGRMALARHRYVLVEAAHTTGTLSIFFFRHDDGSWCVFPPAIARPAMLRLAA